MDRLAVLERRVILAYLLDLAQKEIKDNQDLTVFQVINTHSCTFCLVQPSFSMHTVSLNLKNTRITLEAASHFARLDRLDGCIATVWPNHSLLEKTAVAQHAQGCCSCSFSSSIYAHACDHSLQALQAGATKVKLTQDL